MLAGHEPAHAQCPDGTPPPCRIATAVRRAPPRLDARTWVVLPFTNLSGAGETEWLSRAAANLLYLDLSQWTDIRVIDDGRVADAVRTLPPAEQNGIGLAAGLSLARSLGAGRLVMGDLVPGRGLTAVVAKVYDVASGNRIRSVREEVATRDATLPAFGRLAGRVLDLRPASTERGAVGTTSLDAYQEYLEGLSAMRRWRLDSAYARLRNAIRLDTAFALAYYRISEIRGWSGWGGAIDSSAMDMPTAANAAARFASGLPARERALIRGRGHAAAGRFAAACDVFRELIAADSSDVEALYQLGDCSYHQPPAEPLTPDSSRWGATAHATVAYRAFIRTLELDPDMHLAYAHLLELLTYSGGLWCAPTRCRTHVQTQWELRGDSIIATVEALAPGQPVTFPDSAVLRRNLAAGAALGEQWIAAAPGEGRAHQQYATILARQRRFTEAASAMGVARRVGSRTPTNAVTQVQYLIAAQARRGSAFTSTIALAESALTGLESLSPESFGEIQYLWLITRASVAALAGLPGRIPVTYSVPSSTGGTYVRPLNPVVAMLAAGVTPPDLSSALRQHDSAAAATTGAGLARMNQLYARSLPVALGYLCHGLCTLPSQLAGDSLWRASPLGRLAARDTAGALRALAAQDSLVAMAVAQRDPSIPFDGELAFRVAIGHLALGDSSGARAALEHYERGLEMPAGLMAWQPTRALGVGILLIGRVAMLRADLLVAAGQRAEARVHYQRVVQLFANAEPPYQPLVARARENLARLGN
jgi:tetratricopeptide (TPR) repeat protein